MAEHGNPTQWGQTRPTEETLRKDIKKEQLYVSESLVKVQYLFNKMVFCEQNNYICNIETEMEKFDD